MPPKHVQKKVSADAEEIAHHDDNQLILQMLSLLKDDIILKKLRDALYPQELSNKIDLQARSKQCLIGPAITKLSDVDLGAGRATRWGSTTGYYNYAL